MIELLCAVGVVPTRVYPKSGRISALAGRQGRLRACTSNLPARRLTAMIM
ncbi:replication protein RepA4 [Escherichia coli]|nr:replication protein RepA4 [Escherichia coli]EFB4354221.1 replication protein RepA4 [Escherichia coli]